MSTPLLLSTWSFGQRANAAGWPILATGGSSLDAVEAVGRFAESDLTNPTVGVGGTPDASGDVSLDASIMLSPSRCGAVANLHRFSHAVSIARRVMECTPHVLLAGAQADEFAEAEGFVPQDMLTVESRALYAKWRVEHPTARAGRAIHNVEERGGELSDHDTIGILALDANGVLAGACTTSGTAFKLPGRVGDSPIIGHGLYVDPQCGAAVATGRGELVMGVCGAFLAVEAMRRGATPAEAARQVLDRILAAFPLTPDDQVGIIVLNPQSQWSGSSLRPGFKIAIRTAQRDEVVLMSDE